jgi:putative ABC transport system permease protein
MLSILQDLSCSLRLAVRRPGFTALVVLTLALGIGASTAVFTVIDAVLLHPVPYPDPGRIVSVLAVHPEEGPARVSLTPADFLALREHNRSFLQLGAYVPFGSLDLTGEGEPVRLQRHLVSAGLLEALGVQAAVGRLFQGDDYREQGARVVLLSDRLWRSRFGGDPRIAGRGLTLNGERYTVAGVLPRQLRLPGGDPDLLVPLVFKPADATDRSAGYLGGIGRLRPGVSLARAQADLSGLARGLAEQVPEARSSSGGFDISLLPLAELFGGQARTALWTIFGAVAFLLLITCVNVANLHLVQTLARDGELGIRAALGATALRLVRQLLTENLLSAVLGGALGLLLARLALRLLPDPRGVYLPASTGMALGARALAFTALATLVSAALSGLLPAAAAGARAGAAARGGRGETAAPRQQRLQGGLVVLEISLAFALLLGAGLLVRSFLHLLGQDSGFKPDHVLTLDVSLPAARYGDPQRVAGFYRELTGRIAALPGVVAVGTAKEIPPAEPWSFRPRVEGREVPANASAGWELITPGTLEALRSPLVAGQPITGRDRAGSRPVALVNESAAREILGGLPSGRPDGWGIGRRIRFDGGFYDVIGVVEDQRLPGGEAQPTVYFALAQSTVPVDLMRSLSLVIRTQGEPMALAGAVKGALWSLDRNLPAAGLETLEQRLAAAAPLARSRFNAFLLAVFSGIALLLAAVGIYGVLSCAVRRRTREMGVRMALGAARADVLRLVLRRGLVLTLTGIACGVAGSLVLARLLASLLVGVGSADPPTYLAISAVLAAVAGLACYLPARRASLLDPFEALRGE